jgi:hypothetical protein
LTPDPIGLAGGINHFVYTKNNPIKRGDTYGLYTFGYDLSATAGAGVGATAGYTWVVDTKGNIAKIRHAGGGGLGGIEAGGAFQLQATNAPSVDALAGESFSAGFSVGPKVIEGTGEFIVMPGGYMGLNFGVGASAGPLPVEVHGFWEHSDIVWKANLSDLFEQWLEKHIGPLVREIFGPNPCE